MIELLSQPPLDFLAHPVGPFSRQARTILLRAVAEQPGVGGLEGKAAKDKGASGESGEELVAEIEFWLEGECWPRNEGALVETLLARVDRLEESMRRRLSGNPTQVAAFAPAHRQCFYDSLVELAQQGVAKVLPRQIEQLVAHATPGGATILAAEEENRLLGILAHRGFEKLFAQDNALACWCNNETSTVEQG